MKLIKELSREELLSLLLNEIPSMPIDGYAQCASCGDYPNNEPNADYMYICDKCNTED